MSDDNNVSFKKQDIHDDNQQEKSVPELRFPEFNDEWKKVKLGDIFEFYPTNSFSRSKLNYNKGTVKNIHYGDIHTKFPTIMDINKNNIPFINADINIDKFKTESFCKNGDIIIADASEDYDEIGKTIEITGINDNDRILSGLHTLLARDNNDMLADKFRGYLFQSNSLKLQIKRMANGISVLGISKSNIKKIEVYVPSKSEQYKISNIIYLIDEKIELLEKKLVLWDKHLTYWINELTTENDKYNFSWKNYKLKDFLEEYKEKSQINNQYPLLSSTKEKIVLQEKYFNKRIASKNDKGYKILHKNQLVLSPQNLWLGNININDEFKVGIVSPSYIIYNLNNKIINKNYLKFIIKKPKMLYLYETVSEQGASIVRRNLNKNLFINLKIKLPSITEQEIIGYFLLNLYNKNKMLENKINTIKLFKKGLLQKMFI